MRNKYILENNGTGFFATLFSGTHERK
jgi:hypothetical protein